MNVQVACDLHGNLVWISDPIDGNHHDSFCLTRSGVLDGLESGLSPADKGYLGSGMITPFRKPPGGKLLDSQKEFNTAINKIRWTSTKVLLNKRP
ncbi:transposase family protein [Nocardia jiangxiensis]|uniref:Transposase family protein n=1 Tax=Nocardia jiangxiensis TaxID=282685 RepID=A0ABW6RVS0_9NOCA|nr:transposase family protein [Nocardia jiangxiensis]